MDEYNLGKDGALRVRTLSGLDVKLFKDSLEVELARMPFGLNIEVVDAKSPIGQSAPAGSYYRITFYKPDNKVSEKVNESIAPLPGAIYLTDVGVIIRGARPAPGTNISGMDYSDRV